jgi:hypothetical protein
LREREAALLQDRGQHEQYAVRCPQKAERDDPQEQRIFDAAGSEELGHGDLDLGPDFRADIAQRFDFVGRQRPSDRLPLDLFDGLFRFIDAALAQKIT